MNDKNIEFFYDPEADMLEIFIGDSASPPIFDEISPDLFEGRDETTGELRGYKIFNLTKHKNLKNVKVSLPINISS
tara:strand:+ start:159 stop:386 length:228 start_codon:yes stop_codon:yes gene_type:complete